MRRSERDRRGPRAAAVRAAPGGVGRSTSREAEAVSDDLRLGHGEFVRRRRRVGALSLGAMGSLGMVAAYQLGILKNLPEPPFRRLDADRVDAGGEAYQLFKTPDAAVALASYGVTLVLVGMGPAERAQRRPWVPLAMAAKVAADAAFGLYLTLEQGTKHRRFCSWCLMAAAASVAMVPQVVPEASAAGRHLWRRRG